MVAAQAEGCAPIVRAFAAGERHAVRWDDPVTVAVGIRVPQAVGDFLILDAVRESGGFAIAVSDQAIESAVTSVARDDGTLLCPEGGATLAAYEKALALGLVGRDEAALLFNCATGLRYPLADHSRDLDRHAPFDWATI
jgi:threonine synthase